MGITKNIKPVKGIYLITNPNGHQYIGQSINCWYRWKRYNSHGARQQHRLENSFKKNGVKTHTFEIIHECEESMLNHWEAYYVYFYDTFNTPHGLNLKEGGNRNILTEEAKQRIAKKLTGFKYTYTEQGMKSKKEHGQMSWENLSEARKKELREFYSKIHTGNKYHLGKKYTESHCKNISNSLRGIERSQEFRLNVSNGKKGKQPTPEAIRSRTIGLIKALSTPEAKETKKEASLKNWTNPEYRETHANAMAKARNTPEFKENHLKATKEFWRKLTPEEKKTRINKTWVGIRKSNAQRRIISEINNFNLNANKQLCQLIP